MRAHFCSLGSWILGSVLMCSLYVLFCAHGLGRNNRRHIFESKAMQHACHGFLFVLGLEGVYHAGAGGAGGPDGVERAARAGQRHGRHLHAALPQALPGAPRLQLPGPGDRPRPRRLLLRPGQPILCPPSSRLTLAANLYVEAPVDFDLGAMCQQVCAEGCSDGAESSSVPSRESGSQRLSMLLQQ